MARKRIIDPSWLESQSLGKCKRDARLLFFGLISLADDEGRLRGDPVFLRNTIFAYDEDITFNEVKKYLYDLQNAECIRCYSVNNYNYVDLPKWAIYQKIDRPSPSKLPPCPANFIKTQNKDSTNEQRTLDERSTNEQRTLDSNGIEENRIEKKRSTFDEGSTNTQPNLPEIKNPLPVAESEIKYSQEFEAWYKNYPRKAGKFKAYGYFKKHLKAGKPSIEVLNRCVVNYNAYLITHGIIDETKIKMADGFLAPTSRYWENYMHAPSRDSPVVADKVYFAAQGLQGSDAPQEPTVRDEKQMEAVDELFQCMPKHLRKN